MTDHQNPYSEREQEASSIANTPDAAAERERYQVLRQLEDWLELPVTILGFFWLVLLVIELIWGLNPFLNALLYLIWAVFILDFLLRFILAPQKMAYLKRNALTALSLFIPALRISRVARLARTLRALRAARGLRLVSMVSSVNRGMRALRQTMARRGFGYVIALSMIVTLVGAAGMYAFEGNHTMGAGGFNSYGEALWWTAMIMTTLGSEYWPQTAEGRLLTLLLALFAFAIFGYVTATVATYFIGRDAATLPEQEENDPPVEQPDHKAIPITGNTTGSNEEFLALQAEVKNLQDQLADLNQALVKNQKDRPGE